MNETAAISADITANYPINWTLTLNGTTTSGSGSPSYTWDGKNNGLPVSPGVYNAAITATSGTCNVAPAPLPIKVVEPPNSCKLNVPLGSSANVATGNLSFSQEVFSAKGGVFPLSLTLYYNSLDTTQGSLGPNWRHSYDTFLQSSDNSGKVLAEGGTRHVYTWNGSAYVAETGDTSSLVKNGDTTHDLSFVEGRKYHFLADGTLNTITDKYSNVLTFGYTGTDLTSVTDGGRTITFSYDPVIAHRLTSVTDPNNNIFTFVYQGNLIWKIVNPVTDAGVPAGFWLYTYNTDNLLQSKTDPGYNTIQYGYIGKWVNSSTDPNLKTRGIAYPSTTGNVKTTTFTDKNSGQWLYTYDIQSGFLKEKSPVGGKKTSYYYNSDTTQRAKTEPFDNNFLTTFSTYDGHGNLLTQTDPVDISAYTPAIDPQTVDIASLATLTPPIKTALRYTYDAANFDQVATITDERFTPFRTTNYLYTIENGLNVTTVTDPEGKQTITRYNVNGTMAEAQDGNGKKTTYAYYPDNTTNRTAGIVGLLQSVTTPDTVVTSYTSYDKNGNPLEIRVKDTAQRELRTVQTFDALNRLRTATRYAANLPDNITRYSYDNNNNRTSVIDPETKETKYLYNYQGQATKVTDARLKDTLFEYGGAVGCPSCSGVDKLTAVTDARLKKTSYQYDTLGRLEREIDALNKVIRYTYYDSNLLKDKIDTTTPAAEVILITHYYDTNGHLTKKHYADGTETTFSYYPDGALQTATNPNISYTYTYYNNGWLKSVTDITAGLPGTLIASYDLYDNIGQRITVNYFPTTPDAKTIQYHYDTANRLDTITSPAGLLTIGYDSLSRKQTLFYPNQITATFGYDDLNCLTSLIHQPQTGQAITADGYTHDQAGNRKTKTGTLSETYTYDEIYRLTQADTARGSEKYTYDDVGNRQTGPGPKDTGYQYNDGNQMITGRTLSYLYDNMGNQTQRIINNAPDKSWILTWDYENRLVKVEKSKGTTEKRTTTFKYDPQGRRVEKKHVTLKDGITKTTTTNYVYDGDNIILEISNDGTTATKSFYTHGQGTDEPLAMERGGQFYYYHADGLGSITAITDASRNAVQRYSYDSFGVPKATTTFKNPYQFTGREWDKETGLYYYRARYYDPMDGRFISEDPIPLKNRSQDQLNSYTYAINNPINFTDPNGENIYGNWCGPGGSGTTKDGVDAICKKHDKCFDKTGATYLNNILSTGTNNMKQCINECNKQLCDDLRNYMPLTYTENIGKNLVIKYFGCAQ